MSRVINYIKAYGVKQFFVRSQEKLKDKKNISYKKWRRLNNINNTELEEQRKVSFDYEPLFSFVIPLYKTPEKFLYELIESIKSQTYSNWEICFSDGSGENSPLLSILDELEAKNDNIRTFYNGKQMKIADNTNAAIEISKGDFIVFMDHDDTIEPNALFECVNIINKEKDIDFIYTDEDKVNEFGTKYFDPNFKPDFSINLLRSMNYICHMVVVKKELLEKAGKLDNIYDGAQDYDFVFRCIENAKKIHHIPQILYHWRTHLESTSYNPANKMYAFEAGKKAIEANYKRVGINAEVNFGKTNGLYNTTLKLGFSPLVSIIIPNKDHINDLKKCIDSIEESSTYKNLEYIIIENNSIEKETFKYYETLKSNAKIKVEKYDGDFNFSKIINFGVKHSKGDYLLILNNDTELIAKESIEQMLAYCMLDDVGIVGARLLYPDDTIQHAGVIIGLGGIAGHAFVGLKSKYRGYISRAISIQDYSAVTAACLMVSKKVFEKVNGFNEELAVAFNDIDFCLKVRELGKLVVYNPNCEFYHYESKSRGKENTKEKIARFNSEKELFKRRWSDILEAGDPYYNRNLSLTKYDFSLKGK